MSMKEHPQYEEARRRVKKLKGFYSHLLVFLLVNALLFTVNMLQDTDKIWFIYPLGGWFIGLFFHGMGVFNTFSLFSKDWEDKKIQEFIDRNKDE
ncbi:2TM domain-containing protein [Brevibacillus dissolubilis]|uniref:2TM domain-containing protein n=1 Tax=Brevibacillus dissolubilis TaxID=1844116 RepID=UPI00111797B6|nr:2TM domain-containing protein [Brevibacillus dissolubilis]